MRGPCLPPSSPSCSSPTSCSRSPWCCRRSSSRKRALLFLQAHGSVLIGLGLAITGVGLILALGTQLFSQPWLLVALSIYAGNLLLAFFVQRPNLRRLLGGSSLTDEATWRRRARRQRYVSYAMAGLVGTIAFLMSTKPDLW